MVENNQFDLLSTFFSEKLKCEKSELTEDTDLTLFEGYNSMLVVELILYIEENMHIEIPDEYFGLENYSTIGSIINVFNKIK